MAATQAVPAATHLRKRSFLFALSADQREYLVPGGNRDRLTLSTLSLGFGARDDVHVLEAEGAKADGEKNAKLLVQTTAMLGVQPSLPAVTVTSTVLALPVTFRLRSGPGPLYISGNYLMGAEAPAAAAAAPMSIAKASEEPALKRASVTSAELLMAKVEQLVNKSLSNPPSGAKDSALAVFAAKYGSQGANSGSSFSPAVTDKKARTEGRDPEVRKYYDRLKEIKTDNVLEGVKSKIMASMAKGVRLSVVKFRFERFVQHCHNVTEPDMVAELWKWRQSLK